MQTCLTCSDLTHLSVHLIVQLGCLLISVCYDGIFSVPRVAYETVILTCS